MRFYTADLLSKWGFDDGDLIDNFLEAHDYPTSIIDTSPLWRRILVERVLPEIKSTNDLEWTPSLHNSARAKTVDGYTIDHTASEHPNVNIRPNFVDVPDDLILNWANQLREEYLAIPRNTIRMQMLSGDYSQVSVGFTALQLQGFCQEDHDMIVATCTDERLNESLRRRIDLAFARSEKDA